MVNPWLSRSSATTLFFTLSALEPTRIVLTCFGHATHMLVSNMTVHNMHATVLACTHSNSLYSVLGLGYPHIGTKVNTYAQELCPSRGTVCTVPQAHAVRGPGHAPDSSYPGELLTPELTPAPEFLSALQHAFTTGASPYLPWRSRRTEADAISWHDARRPH